MIEQEFLGIQETPEEVLGAERPARGFGDQTWRAASFSCGGREPVEGDEVEGLDQGLVGQLRVAQSRVRRPSAWVSLRLMRSPFIRCSAWLRVGSVARSHSQAKARTGRPNVSRK